MSPLTKAFVVLATILSVVMVTLTVAVVARVDDYRASYSDLVAAKDAAIDNEVKLRNQMNEQLTAESQLAKDYKNQIDALNAQITAARGDDESAAAQIAELQKRNAQLVAAAEVSAGTIEQLTARVDNLNTQLSEAIASYGDSTGKVAELTQELVAVKATLRRTQSEYNRVVEQNVAYEQQLREAQAKLDSLPEDAIAVTTPGVDGAVTGVDQSTSDITLVEVNVGTRDNVKEDMEFTVYRGDQFVGKIQIVRVDTAASVGRLTLGDGVKAGDRIQSGR